MSASAETNSKSVAIKYDDLIVRNFIFATILWGGVAFLLGVIAALQMADWRFNFNLEWITFGRLRPLHTNAAIFAFAGNTIFAGIYHSTQRLCRTRMYSDVLSRIHFWGWQAIIVGAAIALPLGLTQSKEYAELEWPFDIAIALVWVIFGINFFGTLAIRRVQHMYVALWFYIATIITVAVLHIFNSIEIPVSLFQSYPVYAGIQDALVQWWYGHNAVAFFLTTPFLGLMYYYIPKTVNRPIYSYRLSIIHFWALVFIYIWAGPHHLLNTALPDWAQTLGMVFSLMLWAPSWGGMINGLLTLRGAWNLLWTEPIVKFLITAVTFYGMSTFEGPLLSIKSVNALAHYTDWIIGHVHGGALGWNAFMAFGMIYYIIPKMYKTELFSKSLANQHFWISTIGILIYYTSMWGAGITQGGMWRDVLPNGLLKYPDFVETVNAIRWLYWVRVVGGLMFFASFFIFVYNIIQTVRQSKTKLEDTTVMVAAAPRERVRGHQVLESYLVPMGVLTLLMILIGSVFQFVPLLSQNHSLRTDLKVKPYSPLELAGRDIYVKEGCYVCHSQMVRKTVSDVLRYGPASTAEESQFDRPFQWGSKRTGPDLARIGGKYPDMWHLKHFENPRSVNSQSLMPSYPWLSEKKVDFDILRKKLSVMKMLGVPYSQEMVENGPEMAREEAKKLVASLQSQAPSSDLSDKQVIAIIAYLQSLGKRGGIE